MQPYRRDPPQFIFPDVVDTAEDAIKQQRDKSLETVDYSRYILFGTKRLPSDARMRDENLGGYTINEF
ncbi:MAG: hypothetical protein HQM08_24200 [Candidatus Riflebacteria bacterium]|nr:hypothetical protein [Candidatus Riflebacteria bacterium]